MIYDHNYDRFEFISREIVDLTLIGGANDLTDRVNKFFIN